MGRIVVLVSLLTAFLTVRSQNFSTEVFTVKNGLPQSQVFSLAEDKKLGYLWVGTNGGGLGRFDGKEFTSYTVEDGIRDNAIFKIFIDSRDNVWLATSRGLSKFNGERFQNFDSLRDIFSQMVEFNDTLIALSRRNRLVKIFKDSVYCDYGKLTQRGPVKFLASNSTQSFFYYLDPGILVQRRATGEREVDISKLGKIYNLSPSGDSLRIVSKSGAYVWGKHGLRLLDSRINFPLIYADKKFETLWRQAEKGIEKISRSPETLDIEPVKVDGYIASSLEDSEGNMWFGTDGKGLTRYYANDFVRIKEDIVMSVQKSNDKLWIATLSNGLDVMVGTKVVKHFDNEALGFNGLSTIRKDKSGNIWAASSMKLLRINESTYEVTEFSQKDGLKSMVISSIEIDPNDRLWISYKGGGIMSWNGKTFEDFSQNDQLSSLHVFGTKFNPYGSRLMVLTANGVDEIRNGKVSRLAIPHFADISTLCGTPVGGGRFMVFGSAGKGIGIYDLDKSIVKHYSKKDGLVSGLIFFVDTDDEGYVWIGSDRGIERIRFNDQLDIQEYVYFSDNNGLTGLETNLNASDISGKGKFFGLVDGVYHIVNHDVINPRDFDLHFTKVDLLDSQDSLSNYATSKVGFFKIPNNPKLPYDRNSITFSFTKVSKKYPSSAAYKFMLVGLDNKWSLRESGKEVVYRNLAPGSYKFLVLARDGSGKWMKTPLSYPFVVEPPFYKTSAFLVVAMLFVIMVIVLVIYFNVQRNISRIMSVEKLRHEENIKLRREIGRDFHDEIGNQLARIVNYTSLIKLNGGRTIETLTLVEESAKNLIVGTRDMIWALDPENDSASNLFIHARDFGDRLFGEKDIQFRAFYEVQREIKLPVGYTRQLNLIIKEAMTNSFKYSGATMVELHFKELLFGLKISFSDNGVGISEEKMNLNRGGLVNMRVRAERINTKLLFESGKAGTSVSLIIQT